MSESSFNPFAGLDLLSVSVVMLDAELRLVHLNPAAENLLAGSSKSLLGRSIGGFIAGSPTLQKALASVLRLGWSHNVQNIELRRGDGEVLQLNCTVSPTSVAGASLLLELWPIEQQLKASREEQIAAQQQASRELIRNLAHEIKNPLGGIRGAAQLLERELDKPELREYTQVIIQESDRLQNLMQRLLSPNRAMMRPAEVNIHEILERVRSLLVAEFPQISIRRDYDTSLPELVGDREQLIQAILNLARNSAQAISSQGPEALGEIVLRTRAARQVTLAKRRHRLALEVQVVDDGPGIPDDIRGRMFFPLVSGRDGGSGLGLALVQSFIQQHQGTIDCDSRPGYTCFTLRLPLAANGAR